MFRQILDVCLKKKSFALACHDNVDGDGLGSALALHIFLKNQGKESLIFAGDRSYREFKFLPQVTEVEEAFGSCRRCDFVPEVAVGLDYGNFERLTFPPQLKDKIRSGQIPLITFDHHLKNKQIGDMMVIDQQASCTCEILFDFFETNDIPLNKDMALCLLTGIVTDTNSFKNPATTTKALAIAGQLLGKGLLLKKINQELAKKNQAEVSSSLALALNNLQINQDFNFAYLCVSRQEIAKHKIKRESLDGLSTILATIPDIDFSVTLIEWEPGLTRCSLRSEGKTDVSVLAGLFGGGGHILASGFEHQDTPQKTYVRLIKELQKLVKKS